MEGDIAPIVRGSARDPNFNGNRARIDISGGYIGDRDALAGFDVDSRGADIGGGNVAGVVLLVMFLLG